MPSAALKNSSYEEQIAKNFGEEFVSLFKWAEERNIAYTAELIYHVFEQTPKLIDPLRIYGELSLSNAAEIISGWSDNESARLLNEFYLELKNSPDIRDEYKLIHRLPNAQRVRTSNYIADIKNSGYLLALSYYPPYEFSNKGETYYYETLLRIWFYVHGMHRMCNNKSYDSVLSLAVRYTIIDLAEKERIDILEVFFEKLRIQLDGKEKTFEICNYAIKSAANLLLNTKASVLQQGQKNFLSRLIRIASFESEVVSLDEKRVQQTTKLIHAPRSVTPTFAAPFVDEIHGVEFHELSSHETDDSSCDDDQSFLTVSVSANQTDSEQILVGRGVFIQRAEQSHYLPWSWNKILPAEVSALEGWVEEQLSSQALERSLAGAIMWLAKSFGRSLETAMLFNISDEPKDEWSIASDYSVIRRLPIRRHSAWTRNKTAEDWVAPLGDYIEIPLPEVVSSSLKASASSNIELQQLNQLWSLHSKVSLFKWFNTHKPTELERISSGMFASIFGQSIFDQTGDTALARLLSSYSNNALPAACGYGTWDIDEIEKGQSLTKQSLQRPIQSLLGSMLLPVESMLVQTIKDQANQVRNSETIIDFHNAFTYYTVQALYAATGSRYLVYPFESLERFYISDDEKLQVSCVYINDKQDDTHSGRLVPLCPSAVKHLQNYVSHLSTLAHHLKDGFPELSALLAKLSQGHTNKMPLFFTLDDKLQWYSVSVTKLSENQVFQWPLPNNVFRHRFSQVLTSLQVPSDVLEGWMGHGERGVACYGDFSPRCWQDDALYFISHLEASFSALEFQLIESRIENLPLSHSEVSSVELKPKVFGEVELAEKRENTIQSIKEMTKEEITVFLDERSWNDINTEEFKSFVIKLTASTDKTIALPYALERLNVLYELLDEAESPLSRLVKNRHVRLKQERSYLQKEVISALGMFYNLKKWADEQRSGLYASSLSLRQCSQLATVLFCIERQVSYPAMLKDIAKDENYTLFQYDKETFLRYSEELDPQDFQAPAQHHRIHYKTASFFDTAKKTKISISANAPLTHDSLHELNTILGFDDAPDFEQLIDRLSLVIGQANLVTLPGIVAAGLSERQPPTSLSLQDFVRLKTNRALLLPNNEKNAGAQETTELVPINTKWHSMNVYALQKEANNFHKELISLINQYEKSKARSIEKEVLKLCKSYSSKVSSAVLSVGYWIASVIKTGKYQGRRKTPVPLAKSTISTYFGTLMSVFKDLAYDVDLFSLSEEEITDLYDQMIQLKKEKEAEVDFFGKRLQAFHRMLVNQGLPEIDWSELDFKSLRRTVSSGVLSEQDYIKCLRLIEQNYADKTQAKTLQFILMLCYRFGLRSQEAMQLLRKDWRSHQDDIWVLVRNNKFRALKSESGRRAVPLLFEVTPIERDAIDYILNRYEGIAGNDSNYLLLSEIKDSKIQLNNLCYKAPNELISVMREVTGNNHLVLHHARHTFHNQLAAVLFGIDTPLTRKVTKHVNHEKVLATVLGANAHINRRSSMALCLLMGHAHPSTSLKNYNHLVTEWADHLLPISSSRVHRLDSAIQMDDWDKLKVQKLKKRIVVEYSTPNLQSLTALIRLVALGRTFNQAALALEIAPEHAENLESLLTTISTYEVEELGTIPNSAREFLSHISESAWLRLQSHVSEPVALVLTNPIKLNELPYLIGKKRHILMATDEHYEFINYLIKYFEIPSDCYKVGIYKDSELALEKLQAFNLDGALDKTGKQLDTMNWFMSDGTVAPHRNYSAFWLEERVTCSLRNSYEVVLMLLLIGYMQSL